MVFLLHCWGYRNKETDISIPPHKYFDFKISYFSVIVDSAFYLQKKLICDLLLLLRPVFLNRRAVAQYRALASILLGREGPEKTTICCKISLVQWLITNLNVILYLSTCHTVYISVLMLFMIMP